MLFYLERSGRPPLGGGFDTETQTRKAEEQGQRPGGQNKCVVFEGRQEGQWSWWGWEERVVQGEIREEGRSHS